MHTWRCLGEHAVIEDNEVTMHCPVPVQPSQYRLDSAHVGSLSFSSSSPPCGKRMSKRSPAHMWVKGRVFPPIVSARQYMHEGCLCSWAVRVLRLGTWLCMTCSFIAFIVRSECGSLSDTPRNTNTTFWMMWHLAYGRSQKQADQTKISMKCCAVAPENNQKQRKSTC